MDTINYFHILRKRLVTLGVKPNDARKVAATFDTQVKSQGIYNALDYYKRVGETLIGYLSKSGYQAPWVKTRDGFPVKLWCLRSYDLNILLRVAKMARALELSVPTKAQVNKLRDAATAPYNGTDTAQLELSRLIGRGIKLCNFDIPDFPEGFKSVISQARTFQSRSVPTGTSVGLDIKSVLSVFKHWNRFIVNIPNWEEAVYPLHPSWVGRNASNIAPYPFAGEIGGVMENGGKLRLFAAPSVLLQVLLEPLQIWLDSIRQQVPSDVFKNQISGAQWAQDKMNQGVEVQSIDLSAATCRFPFEAQHQLCEELGAPRWMLDLYREVSRQDWSCQPHMTEWLGIDTLHWSVGQPLGVNPSMSSFALCHNLLLVGLADELGLDPWDSFRVLGDDVVTCHTELEVRYRELISSLGIKISEHKSFCSKEYGEFAGFSITPDALVRPGRWRVASWMNIQGLVTDLGPNVIDELRQDQHLLERIIAFSRGTYDPPCEEWSTWLMLSSMVINTSTISLNLRDKEVRWYDGACKWLSCQLPDAYFQPSKFPSILKKLKDASPSGLTSIVSSWSDSYRAYEGFINPSSLITQCLSIAEDTCDIHELLAFVDCVKAEYEDLLWSIPKTPGRIARDQRKELDSALLSVLDSSGLM